MMLTMGGELLKAGLKAVAEMVVGDRGTFAKPVAGEVDERLRPPEWFVVVAVDELLETEAVDEEVEMRCRRAEPRERPEGKRRKQVA